MDPHGDNFPIFPMVLAAALLLFWTPAVYAAVSEAEIPGLIRTIVAAESSGRPWVTGDGGKARGLMQLQQGTWERHTRASWARAYEPALNLQVGEREVRRIVTLYGRRATPAKVVFTYNTGRFCRAALLPSWTRKHPNAIYRALFRPEAAR